MSDRFPFLDFLFRRYRGLRFRVRYRAGRWKRAWSYARDRLSADDAQQILIDCERPAGWFPLLILAVDDALAQAQETYGDHPALRGLVTAGCAHVHRKWECYNDELYHARDWAIDYALGYARDENIALVLRVSEDFAEPDALV